MTPKPARPELSLAARLEPHGLPGRLVAVSGIDGSGKTTTLRTIRGYLASRGVETRTWKLPSREVKQMSLFRTYVEDPLRNAPGIIDYPSLCLILLGDRLQTIRTRILPLLRRGVVVLADRYLYTPLAELHALGCDPADLPMILAIVRRFPAPDLAILTDVSLDTAAARIRQRPDERDADLDRQLYRLRLEAFRKIAAEHSLLRIDTEVPLSITLATLKPHLDTLLLPSYNSSQGRIEVVPTSTRNREGG